MVKKVIQSILVYIARKILSKELDKLERTVTNPEVRYQIPLEVFEREIVSKLPRAVVTSTTTDLQAAALVGQQQVLDLLRNSPIVSTR